MAVPFGQRLVRSQNLDHLGLVAGIYDELGIGEVLDRSIPQDTRQRQVTVGQAVKALVLNGLGFINRALYLVPQFFVDKPTGRLIGAGILPEHLNDDVLGRALDALYAQDVTTLYTLISAEACHRLGLVGLTVHLDSTSFHVDGDYDREVDLGVVELTRGYSRDHRPDLNQVMLNLIVDQRAGLPLLMQPLSGASQRHGELWVPDRVAHRPVEHHPLSRLLGRRQRSIQRGQPAAALGPSRALDHPRTGDAHAGQAAVCGGGFPPRARARLPLSAS